MKTFMALLAVLCLGLFAITPTVSTEITNTSTSVLVVEEGSIPATELCNTADGKAFPGDTVTLYEDRRRKPMIFSRGMNPYTPRKPYIPYKHITF